nr:DNA methyltransferase [Roseicella sp. DB1501]
MPGPALAIRAGKNNRTPVFVDLAALAAKRGREREKYLKEEADRGGLPARVAQALAAAEDAAALADALRPIVDERGSPHGPVPTGTPLLQPTDERRRTGSHYTPRTLTEPIVRHALEPAFARIGPDATPEEVLALKVCDPAMGSGAFLVEACRQLAARLVAAWTRHPGTRPTPAEDEDEDLLARRLVAQRCLYGVDKNPMATDLARLSLWLATLARDHEFTFLDHALKSGDSLVGLTRGQIGALTWGDDRQGSLMSGFVRGRVAEAVRARTEIREAPDDVERAVQEARHRALEGRMADVRTLGDAVLACFFGHDKPRTREAARRALAALPGGGEAMWAEARRLAATLGHGAHPIRPFHWELEFPEVFEGREGGFDAIVGNPPFAGKNTLINGHREHYLDWLQELHEGAHGNADLVAHFFRRAFGLLRPGGCFGLIATNTVGQGDTRESGLRQVIEAGGAIARAVRRLPWPGEAAVVVSVVHVVRGQVRSPVLDGRKVWRISAFLMEGDLDASPARLAANARKSFQGTNPVGAGFLLIPQGERILTAVSGRDVAALISPGNELFRFVKSYTAGEDIAGDPQHRPGRKIIDFGDLCEATARELGGELFRVLEDDVRPSRATDKRDHRRLNWWRHGEPQKGLYEAIRPLQRVIALPQTSPHLQPTIVPNDGLFASTAIVFASDSQALLGLLQSRPHEVWTRFFTSSLKTDLRYAPSDCFETFPLPPLDHAAVHDAAEAYHTHRAALMVARNEGLTRTYNRFHNPAERAADIARLRELHHALDLAVLRAYGWYDLADRAVPEFLTEDTEPDHRYQGRLFWPAPFRDEVLARLLDLNRARAAEERALGLSPRQPTGQEEEEDEAA